MYSVMKTFVYRGCMSVDGDADAAVDTRIRIGWNKFRQLVPLITIDSERDEWWMLACYVSESRCILHIAQLMQLSLTISCSSKSKLVLPFWCWLPWVVLNKIQEGRSVCVCVCVHACVHVFVSACVREIVQQLCAK